MEPPHPKCVPSKSFIFLYLNVNALESNICSRSISQLVLPQALNDTTPYMGGVTRHEPHGCALSFHAPHNRSSCRHIRPASEPEKELGSSIRRRRAEPM